jgi:hypothetical protein
MDDDTAITSLSIAAAFVGDGAGGFFVAGPGNVTEPGRVALELKGELAGQSGYILGVVSQEVSYSSLRRQGSRCPPKQQLLLLLED